MEKTLTRLKTNLKCRRKLSLPMLAGQLPWNNQHSNQAVVGDRLIIASRESINEAESREDVLSSDNETEISKPAISKAWLSFGKSRHLKNRKPRRWPSTPTFVPATTTSVAAAAVTAVTSPVQVTAAASAREHSEKPQSHNIHGYNLTLPNFLRLQKNRSNADSKVKKKQQIYFLLNEMLVILSRPIIQLKCSKIELAALYYCCRF